MEYEKYLDVRNLALMGAMAFVGLHCGGTEQELDTQSSEVRGKDSPAPTPPEPRPAARRHFLVAGNNEVTGHDADGLTLWRSPAFGTGFTGEVRVAQGDVNGDGVNDILLAPGGGGASVVRILDGVNRRQIGLLSVFSEPFRGGVFVASADVNGDGRDDVIASAGEGGLPVVHVYDGASNNLICDFMAMGEQFRGGLSIAAADFDGDGAAEILAGARAGGRPYVARFAGETCESLGGFDAFANTYRGGVNVAAGDINGDGMPEVIAGTASDSLYITAYSLANGAPQQILHMNPWTNRSGVRISARDMDGDGRAEIVAGSGPGTLTEVRLFTTNVVEFASRPFAYRGGVYVSL